LEQKYPLLFLLRFTRSLQRHQQHRSKLKNVVLHNLFYSQTLTGCHF